jgi:hypothetical protein
LQFTKVRIDSADSKNSKQRWEILKKTEGVTSDAMEDLFQMKGIEKVKTSMVQLFEMAIFLNKQDPETRDANKGSHNYCLLGNPVRIFTLLPFFEE